MDPSFYEKEADAANYIYFQRNVITDAMSAYIFPHYHDSIEFVFMIRGECLVHINTEEKTVRAGEITFARCFEPHFYIPKQGAEYYVVLISSRYITPEAGMAERTFPSFMERCEHGEKILRFLDLYYSDWDPADELLKCGLSDTLLAILRQSYPMTEIRDKKTTQTFVELLKYINENFRREITLESLARQFGHAKNYLSVLFNKLTGMNLREYINRRRINAYFRLKDEHPREAVCSLAESCGFNSMNTFYRVLRKAEAHEN